MPTNNAIDRQQLRPAANAGKPTGILVLGMHRSGTSACTRVLNLLGCALPDRLIGPGVGNEAGHWESADVVKLNDRMLTSAGSGWEDWGPINKDWRRSAIRTEMIAQARSIVEEHGQLGPLFAIKDPRMCRLADVWFEAMDASNVDPRAIVMLRNPAEVTASLENRDLMAPGYSQLLWLRHVLDAEFFSRGQRRIFIRYDQLMSNWQGVLAKVATELGVPFPRNSLAVHDEIDQFLSADRRHHNLEAETTTANPGLSDWLRRILTIMLTWSEQGEDINDHRELDAVREEFDRAYNAFARLLSLDEATGRLGSGVALKQEFAAKLAEVQEATDVAREAERLLASAQSELEEQRDTGAKLAGCVATLESTLSQREEEVAQISSASKQAEEREEQERLQRIAAEQKKQELERIVEEQKVEIDTLVTRLQRQEEKVLEVQRGRSLLEERLTERFGEISDLTIALQDENLRAEDSSDKLQWLQQVLKERQNFPSWWAILPSAWRCRRECERLHKRGLFDSDKYLEIYPDVAEDGMNPVGHYIMHGMHEGRQRPV